MAPSALSRPGLPTAYAPPTHYLYDTLRFHVEATRVASLYECKVAFSDPEKRFDDIANLAQNLFSIPVALIGIFQENTVYFKHGWSCLPPSIDRLGSFPSYVCVPTHAAAVVVGDTTRDARFAEHPSCLRDTRKMRFWSGCPLLGKDGHRYGSICLFDFVPRQFPATWLNIITNLAELTAREMERDRAIESGLSPAASEPVLMVKVQNKDDWDLMYCNEAFEKFTGIEDTFTVGGSGCNFWDHFELADDGASKEGTLAAVIQEVQDGNAGCVNLRAKRGHSDVSTFQVVFCLAGTHRLSNAQTVNIPSFVPFAESSMHENSVSSHELSSPEAKPTHIDESLWIGVVTLKESAYSTNFNSPISILSPRVARSKAALFRPEGPFLLPVVPQKLSGVKLGPLLGQGSYGKVYRGQYADRQVAVKILAIPSYGEINNRGSMGDQIIAEALLSKHLSHPHVVETLDYVMVGGLHNGHVAPPSWTRVESGNNDTSSCLSSGCTATTASTSERSISYNEMWIVQELCDKGSLYDGIESGMFREAFSLNSPASMPLVYQTASEIASAMQYLHAQGILHGDLTGNNVLLTTSVENLEGRKNFKAVVCDFGLATCCAAEESKNEAGDENQHLGSLSHM